MIDQELPLANKNRKRKLDQIKAIALDQISDSSDKPRVRIKKKEALENITAQLKSENENQSTLDKNRPSCSSGENSVSGQTTISDSGQTSGSGPIAKKNKFRD